MEQQTPTVVVDDPEYTVTRIDNGFKALKSAKVHDTGELVDCEASVRGEHGMWRASFLLWSREAGTSTYHAQAELDALTKLTFDDAQIAMDAAISALEAGFESLASARETDDEGVLDEEAEKN